jgi:hypothetical protein
MYVSFSPMQSARLRGVRVAGQALADAKDRYGFGSSEHRAAVISYRICLKLLRAENQYTRRYLLLARHTSGAAQAADARAAALASCHLADAA